MTSTCPHHDVFAPVDRPHDAPDPVRRALRDAGPLVPVDAPFGGSMWVVTEESLARAVLADTRIVKDTAFAPAEWDRSRTSLEPSADEQLSLTTADGPVHAALRRAHAPLFTPRRMRAFAPRARELAVTMLADEAGAAGEDGVTDLMASFTARYSAAVVLDVLGVPEKYVDTVVDAVHGFLSGDPLRAGPGLAAVLDAAAAALDRPEPTESDELRDRMPAGTTRHDVHYAMFGVILAGQLTTEAALGDLLAAALDDAETPAPELVESTLRRYAPATLSLWRFTSVEMEIAGQRLPARSPIMVDLRGVCAGSGPGDGADLAFGSGPHFCLGAALARVEMTAVVEVLRERYPDARLAADTRLRRVGPGGVAGEHLVELPVVLAPLVT